MAARRLRCSTKGTTAATTTVIAWGFPGPCNHSAWERIRGGYQQPAGVFGRIISFNGSLATTQAQCCSRFDCIAVAYNADLGVGFLLRLVESWWKVDNDYDY